MDGHIPSRFAAFICTWIYCSGLFASGGEILEWQRTFDGVPTRPAVLSDGRIAVGLRFPDRFKPNPPIESFFLLSPTGSNLWSFPTQYGISAGPCVGPDDTIFFTHLVLTQGIAKDTLVALDPQGKVRWSRTLPSLSSDDISIGGDGTILIPGQNPNTLMAFFETGDSMWAVPFGSNLNRHPSIGIDGTLFISAIPSFGIMSANGKAFWAPTNNVLAWGPPAIDRSGNAWALNEFGDLVTFSSAGGILSSRTIPKADPPIPVRVTPSTSSSYEPVIGEEGNVYLVGARSFERARIVSYTEAGVYRWGFTVTNRVLSPPAVARGGTLFLAVDTEVLEFSDLGELVRSLPLGYPINLPPTLTPEGRLLVVGTNQLTSLKPGFEFPTQAPWPMFRADPRGSSSRSQSLTTLSTPKILSSEIWVGANTIVWEIPARPSLYKILRALRDEPIDKAIPLATVSSADGKYQDTTITPGTYYHYWIQAIRGELTSALSQPLDVLSTLSRKRWSYTSDRIWGNLRVGPEGNLYFVETRTNQIGVTALRPTGELLWHQSGLTSVFGTSRRGTVYAGDSRLQELTPEGQVLRSLELGPKIWSSPAIAPDDTLWITIAPDQILKLNPDFTIQWSTNVPNGFALGPVSLTAGGFAFLRQGYQSLVFVTPEGEATSLSYNLSIQTDRLTIGLDGRALVPDKNSSSILAIDATGSSPKLPGQMRAAPNLCLSDVATNLYVMMLTTNVTPGSATVSSQYETALIKLAPNGTVLWKKVFPTYATLQAITEGGGVVVSQPGIFSALAPDGSTLWSAPAPEAGTAVVGVDGRVYWITTRAITCLETDIRLAEGGWVADGGDAHGNYRAKLPQRRDLKVRKVSDTTLSVGIDEASQDPAVLLWSSDFLMWRRWTDQWFTNGNEVVEIPLQGATGGRFLKAVAP